MDGPRGALVEVNSETDFVARNAKFQEFVEKVLEVALEKAGGEGPAPRELDVQELLESEHPGSPHIGDSIQTTYRLACCCRCHVALAGSFEALHFLCSLCCRFMPL